MKKRLKEMEEEAAALRDMQAKVEKEMGGSQGPNFLLCSHLLVWFGEYDQIALQNIRVRTIF